ncbi:MAG TPA: alpha/beta fold hydrolase [Prosthecobacter sp.]
MRTPCMHHVRKGKGHGSPLLLVHGLGGSIESWCPVFQALVKEREVISVDLPGHGRTPPLHGETSIRTLADALTEFLRSHNLLGIDAVGSSMGARLVLELARRGGVLGAVVALNPGGFWRGWERPYFYISIAASIRLLRLLRPLLPGLTRNPVSRALLFAQFSAHPVRLSDYVALTELTSFIGSPCFDELLSQLAYGEEQAGAPRGSLQAPLMIGWGRNDRVCLPRQAPRALTLFPDARLHWFESCGHFPHWDAPEETVRLILANTGAAAASASSAGHASAGL